MRQQPGSWGRLPTRFFRDPKTRRVRMVDAHAAEGFLVLVADEAERSRAGGDPGVSKLAWDDYCAQLGIGEDRPRVERMFAAFQMLGWVEIIEADEFGFKVYLPNAAEWNGTPSAARMDASRARKEAEIAVGGGRYTDDHRRLCLLLADLILKRDPKVKVAPESVAWMDACRLLIDRDGRSPAEVEHIIRWCQRDEFWRTNVLSMPTLRKQFDRLAAKAPKLADKKAWAAKAGIE